MTKTEEASYYIAHANHLREQATELLEEAQRYTKLGKKTVREAVLEAV